MSHEDHVAEIRRRVSDVAEGVLSGDIDILDGARRLTPLLGELGLDWDDEDYHAVAAVESETDGLPIGRERGNWSASALAAREGDILKAVQWAAPIVRPACERLVVRFRPCES